MKFEYLDPAKLIGTDDFKVVESFLNLTGRTQIGWHYIVDLTWIYSKAKHWPVGLRVLDAGGGSGPAQFLLAEMGMNVVNVDLHHPGENPYYAKRYRLERDRLDSYVATDYVAHLVAHVHSAAPRRALRWLRQFMAKNGLVAWLRYKRYKQRHDRWRSVAGYSGRHIGRLTRVVGNLCNMPEMFAESFDAVVSLSALEHVPLKVLPDALKEIDRVVKQDAYRAITTSATERQTWFHEPSKGLCFAQTDLEKLFGAELVGTSEPAMVLEKYRGASYLRDHLADFYTKSGDNGMPWGEWNPEYVPVGIRE